MVRRLATVLADVADVVEESDGALTVTLDGAAASLRVVPIDDELELVSLTRADRQDVVGYRHPGGEAGRQEGGCVAALQLSGRRTE